MTIPSPAGDKSDGRAAWARRWAWRCGALALAAACLFVGVVLARSAWNPLRFAHIGTAFSEDDPEGYSGYDGQFFYAIARDWTDATPAIDGPSLRYMRILYPLAARLLALGQPALVPWTLILVNVLACAAGTGLTTYLVGRRGAHPAWGLLYIAWVGTWFVVRLDLSELLCFALALGAVVTYEHRRIGPTAALLVLATLAKELGLVFAAGLALHALVTDRRWRDALLIGLAPLLTFAGWLLILRAWLGRFPFGYPAARLHLPFVGLLTVEDPATRLLVGLWLGLPTALLAGLALWQIGRARRLSLSAALLLAGAGFVMVMPHVSWEDALAAFRVGMPLVITGLLFLAEHRPRLLPLTAAFWLPALLLFPMTPGLLGY